jgi:hypothetical protein
MPSHGWPRSVDSDTVIEEEEDINDAALAGCSYPDGVSPVSGEPVPITAVSVPDDGRLPARGDV